MKNRFFLSLLIFELLCFSCKPDSEKKEDVSSPKILLQLNAQLTEAILQDGFSPPVASRIYTYPNIAAYEILRHLTKDWKSMGDNLNGFPGLPEPETEKPIHLTVSAIEAFVVVAQSLIYRDYLMDSIKSHLYFSLKTQEFPEELLNNSLHHGRKIAEKIIEWASSDGYKKTRNKAIYIPSQKPGAWEPTPPTYGESLEPYWFEHRCFVMDSASQFFPLPYPL